MKAANLVVFLASPSLILAYQPPSRIKADISSSQIFTLKGNTRPVVAEAQDEGPVSPDLALPHIALHFAMTASQQAQLLQLLTNQQTRGNSQYHQWLTPEQYGEQFGVNQADLQKVVDWLGNQGFSNIEVARSRNAISFSGTAAQAESAFQTTIHHYLVNGQAHFANATDPALPKPLEGMVESIRGLHDFHPKPLGIRRKAVQAHFTSSISGNHYLVPDDFATIYDVKPLYNNGINGTGQLIAIPGQTDIALSDIEAFRSAAGLPQNNPQVILTGPDPGTSSGDLGESDLDIEWAGGIAPNATIIFVNSTDVFTSVTYAVDNNVAPVLSITYGDCEADIGSAELNTLATLFAQANAQGITVLAASGDEGAADCDSSNARLAHHGLAVDVPAAIPYVTGLGGTEFNEGSGTYWGTTNDANAGSALSYIPEIAWNDTAEDGTLSATGGGASMYFSKPTWQSGTGVPNDGARDVPDLALTSSADHDGLLICSGGSCVNGFRDSSSDLNVIGGTSAAAPSFAAIVALLNQQTGERQGNINPILYALAAVSTNVYHDITQGNNIVPCLTGSLNCPVAGEMGYSTDTGYDPVTGWGSIDAFNLLSQWPASFALPLPEMPGGAQQLSVGADGTVWGLNTTGEVYLYNSLAATWSPGSQTFSQIAVGSNGAVWGLDATGNIYRYNSSSQSWSVIPGNLSQIAVGSDGAVWGINAAGQIFEFNSQAQTWTVIPGILSQIQVGFDGAVWGLNSAGLIYRINPGAQTFQYVPGVLTQISIGADGDVWGLNSSGSIWHFNRLIQDWEWIPGNLRTISVGSASNVWGINAQNNVYSFNTAIGTWTQFPGTLRSISASANGSAWGVDFSNQSYQLAQPTQSLGTWHPLPGILAQLAISSDGNVWGLNAANQIYTFDPLIQNWVQIPGLLSQIAVAANGIVWGINSSNQIYRFDTSTRQFDFIPGRLSQIAVADTGDVWGINASNQIYRYNSAIQTWTQVPGLLSRIAVGADGDVWGINSQSAIYHFSTQAQTWIQTPGLLSQISVGSRTNVWGLDASGYVYSFNQQWYAVPGNLAQIATAFDGAVWGVNSSQQVYQFNSQAATWNSISGALTNVTVGSDAVVWGLNSSGQIYRFQ